MKQPNNPLVNWLVNVVPENGAGLANAGEWLSANSTKNPMPGGPGFRASVPNGRIDDFQDRWTWSHDPAFGMVNIWTGDATGAGVPKFDAADRLDENNKGITAAAGPYSFDPGGLPIE